MRCFYNIKDGKFNSFYIEGLHNDLIFSKYIQKENGEIESEVNSNFFEISKSEYERFYNTEGEILYKNGELIKYVYPICIEQYIAPTFNWDTEQWEEGATLEEQEVYYRNRIITLNKRITEIETSGFGANDLKVELETLKQKHLEITHLLGLEIDKTIV